MYKWDIFEISIERNLRDSRAESWKLSSYARKEDWIGLKDDVRFIRKADKVKLLQTLLPLRVNSIAELNRRKVSIGLIPIKDYRIYWNTNGRYINSSQYGMFEDVQIAGYTGYTKESKTKECRIYFRDIEGEHDIQFNEWQVYEYQRKYGAKEDAFRFYKESDLLLVGNMHNHRNVWIGLTMFKSYIINLFDLDKTYNNTFSNNIFLNTTKTISIELQQQSLWNSNR